MLLERVTRTVREAVGELGGDPESVVIERPRQEGHGDYATNIALRMGSIQFAEKLARHLERIPGYHAETTGGFVNITIASSLWYEEMGRILKEESSYAAPDTHKGQRASVEFISANPTGPLHVGNARGGPLGDVIAALLKKTGYTVVREYLHNDAGAQIEKFRDSLWHWYLLENDKASELGEDHYHGVYVQELARNAAQRWGGSLIEQSEGKETLLAFALDELRKENFETIANMGITFDVVTVESELLQSSKTAHALDELQKKGIIQEKEGALWYVPRDAFLKDRETVVVKGDGTYLYFANDIAYHLEKFRKNDLVVDVLGEGHAGHIPKLRSIAHAFEFPQEQFRIVIHGQVHIEEEGRHITMSKRRGTFITAREVLDEVGKDAFRFFLLQYSPRAVMTFDLDLAKKRSQDNPVYYVQYSYARSHQIFEKAGEMHASKADLALLTDAAELSLIKKLVEWPEIIERITGGYEKSGTYEVHQLTTYSEELARSFHRFYETCYVLVDDAKLRNARLALVKGYQIILKDVLDVLGISAPEHM